MTALLPQQQGALVHAFSTLDETLDVLIIDTAPGISDTVASFVSAAQEVIIVICYEPSSMSAAYALIKLLHDVHHIHRVRVIANRANHVKDGQLLFDQLNALCSQSLDSSLQYIGAVPEDTNMRKAAQKRKPILEYAPLSKASLAFQQIAEAIHQ